MSATRPVTPNVKPAVVWINVLPRYTLYSLIVPTLFAAQFKVRLVCYLFAAVGVLALSGTVIPSTVAVPLVLSLVPTTRTVYLVAAFKLD